MLIPFSKYNGCGNDFILIDNRPLFWPVANKSLSVRLCDRRRGIGADGIILLENAIDADFKMRIFNADGSEAEMCGNGIRCLMKFIMQLGLAKKTCLIESLAERHEITLEGENVCVAMGEPVKARFHLSLSVDSLLLNTHFVNTGVPHAIIQVEDIEDSLWMQIAPKIRRHDAFSPHGANVNFMRLVDREIQVRTFERGVESETLACGTGATAVAYVAHVLHQIPSPITIRTRSGDCLAVTLKQSEKGKLKAELTGPAVCVYHGTIDLNL